MNLGDFIPALRWLDLQHVELKLKDAEMELRRCLENLIDLKRTEMSKWSWQEIDDGANERDIMSKLLSLEGEERLSEDQLQSVVFVSNLICPSFPYLNTPQTCNDLLRFHFPRGKE